MKTRYRLTRRGCRGDTFYCIDTTTGKRTSLHTSDEAEAARLLAAKNEAERQPMLNRHLARAYLAGSHAETATRTWRDAIEATNEMKHGANRNRWQTFSHDRALAALLPLVIVETEAGALLAALQRGTVSTNVYLRRLHNFCLDLGWLFWPLIPKRQWPAVRFKTKRAITVAEHEKIFPSSRTRSGGRSFTSAGTWVRARAISPGWSPRTWNGSSKPSLSPARRPALRSSFISAGRPAAS